MKAYDESYSKIITGHKYKDKDNDKDNDKDKDTDKVPEKPNICYIFLNPDDLLIPNMMIDTSPWSSCSPRSPWLACSGHTFSSTGPSVSPFRDFFTVVQKIVKRTHISVESNQNGVFGGTVRRGRLGPYFFCSINNIQFATFKKETMQVCHLHNKIITAYFPQLFSPSDEKKGV